MLYLNTIDNKLHKIENKKDWENLMLYLNTIDNKLHKIENKKDWLEIKYPVKRMYFYINTKESIVLEGFDSYLRVFEYIQGIYSSFKTTSKIILLGRYKNQVMKITLDLIKNKIDKKITTVNKVYNNKPLNSSFWKQGVKGIPRIYIKR